jgi:hypothetical protein
MSEIVSAETVNRGCGKVVMILIKDSDSFPDAITKAVATNF